MKIGERARRKDPAQDWVIEGAAFLHKDFQAGWTFNSTTADSCVRSAQVQMNRSAWMGRLNSFSSYRAEIARVESAGPTAILVILNEFVTLRLPRGPRIEQQIESQDLWLNQNGWKLVKRNCFACAPSPIRARPLSIEALK